MLYDFAICNYCRLCYNLNELTPRREQAREEILRPAHGRLFRPINHERKQQINMEKLNVVALFGGQSSEHVVSCMSVQNVAANINKEKYNVILVGITEEGRWLKVDSLDEVKNDTWRTSGSRAVLSPDASEKV